MKATKYKQTEMKEAKYCKLHNTPSLSSIQVVVQVY